MGNYATNADVFVLLGERLIRHFGETAFGAGTIPTDTTVDDWIDQYEADVDSMLQNPNCNHTTPITEAASILRLKRYVSRMVAVDVWYAVFPNAELPSHMEDWQTDFNEALSQMADCKFFLADTSASTGVSIIYTSVWTD
jgi:hypothetical protein